VAPLLNEGGEVSGGVLIIRDVTPTKMVENALKEQQGLLDGVLASVAEGIAVLDRNLTLVRVNPTTEKWFAHDQPLVGKNCYAVIHGALDPCENCPALKTLVSGEPAHEVVSKWGPRIDESGKVELFSYPLKDPATGDTVGVILRMLDITARVKTEAILKENLERLKLVMTNLPLTLGRLYPDGTVDFLGNNLEQLTGYAPQEFAPGGRPWTEVILEEDQEQVRKSFLHALGTDHTYVRQYRVRTKTAGLSGSRKTARSPAIPRAGPSTPTSCSWMLRSASRLRKCGPSSRPSCARPSAWTPSAAWPGALPMISITSSG
jgi:PAS domain S-box-containing protein